MIGYTTVGTNDMDRASKFYDELFAVYGAKRTMEFPGGIVWGTSPKDPGFGVLRPFNGQPASSGNGVMIALICDSKEKVNAVYNKAIELGGADEGKPGPRGESGFYAGYFRDLDGNKLNAFCMLPKA